MIELPRALKTWSDELALFPAEIASALAPLLPRVERVIGALRAADRAGNGEPDGFDGLSRRGVYDRLLISEWLLAEEAPLEFARRAATGEHAFLRLARREPQGAPLCIALFDAGPNQLGAPRLAHLAALIVLFRRAQTGGAHFRWGMLQQSENSPHETLTQNSIRELLTARSGREATSKEWNRWRETVAALRVFHKTDDAPDVWIVGGERLQRALRVLDIEDFAPALLQIREPFSFNDPAANDAAAKDARSVGSSARKIADATNSNEVNGAASNATNGADSNATTPNAANDQSANGANGNRAGADGEDLSAESQRAATNVAARQLFLSVLRRETASVEPREIALDLPPNSACARLLRDPFATVASHTKSTASRFAANSNFIWASATKLMARSADGASLVVYAVPNSPRAQSGKPRLYSPSNCGAIIAAGRARKAIVVVTQIDGNTLEVQAWGKSRDSVPQGRFELTISLPESAGESFFSCCLAPQSNIASPTLFVQLPKRRLVKLKSEIETKNQAPFGWKREARFENQNVLALQKRDDDVLFVAANRGLVQLKNDESADLYKFGESVREAFFGWIGNHAEFGLVAARLNDELWEVPIHDKMNAPHNSNYAWKLESSTRIVGVARLPDWTSPALIEIRKEREVVLLGIDWTLPLFVANAPIAHASASPFAPDIALCTTRGEIAVWSLLHNAWTLRLAPDDTS